MKLLYLFTFLCALMSNAHAAWNYQAERYINDGKFGLFQHLLKGLFWEDRAENGDTYLHIATRAGRENFVRAIVLNMPEAVDAENDEGLNPLQIALSANHEVIAQILRECSRSGSETSSQTSDGYLGSSSRKRAISPSLYEDGKNYFADKLRRLSDSISSARAGAASIIGGPSFLPGLSAGFVSPVLHCQTPFMAPSTPRSPLSLVLPPDYGETPSTPRPRTQAQIMGQYGLPPSIKSGTSLNSPRSNKVRRSLIPSDFQPTQLITPTHSPRETSYSRSYPATALRNLPRLARPYNQRFMFQDDEIISVTASAYPQSINGSYGVINLRADLQHHIVGQNFPLASIAPTLAARYLELGGDFQAVAHIVEENDAILDQSSIERLASNMGMSADIERLEDRTDIMAYIQGLVSEDSPIIVSIFDEELGSQLITIRRVVRLEDGQIAAEVYDSFHAWQIIVSWESLKKRILHRKNEEKYVIWLAKK